MSDPSQPQSTTTPDKAVDNNTNTTKNKDELAREAALKTMQEYDKLANSGKDLDTTGTKAKKKGEDDPQNPTIPVEYQEVLNMAIEKDRVEQAKQFNKTLKEKDDIIAELEGKINKYVEQGREAILDNYIDKSTFKDEAEYKKRREFYANLSKDLKMSNEQLEELMKGHYQVQEVKYLTNKKGKGAGSEELNTDPFGFNNREDNGFGRLSSSNSSNSKQGLGAGLESTEDSNEDNTNTAASAVASAF